MKPLDQRQREFITHSNRQSSQGNVVRARWYLLM